MDKRIELIAAGTRLEIGVLHFGANPSKVAVSSGGSSYFGTLSESSLVAGFHLVTERARPGCAVELYVQIQDASVLRQFLAVFGRLSERSANIARVDYMMIAPVAGSPPPLLSRVQVLHHERKSDQVGHVLYEDFSVSRQSEVAA